MTMHFVILCILSGIFTTKGFLLDSITMSSDIFDQCSTCDARAERAGNRAVADTLREFMKTNHVKMAIESGDVSITTTLPNEKIETGHSCWKTAEARDVKVAAKMVNSEAELNSLAIFSALNNGFIAGVVPHEVTVNANIRVYFGSKWFGKCFNLGRKTCGVEASSKGENLISVNLAASDVATAIIDGKEHLQFVLDVSVQDETNATTYAAITVPTGSGCNLNILGIKVGSINNNIQKYANSFLNGQTSKITELRGPALVKRLENVLKAKLGSSITIPVIITDPGRRKRSAVPGCKRMECPAGFTRIGNTDKCQKFMGLGYPDCSKYGTTSTVHKKTYGSMTFHWCHTDMIAA